MNKTRASSRKARYGFDAPGVMRGLLLTGLLGASAGIAAGLWLTGWLRFAAWLIAIGALIPLGLGLCMLAYGLRGKYRIRDFMIGLIDWRGGEQVLDVGTGRGLLLIAAAKRLGRRGRATGIDIWREQDLSNNSLNALAANIAAEGVEDRTAILTEDAQSLSFPDRSFDVILSLFCIHNIPTDAGQASACREIARTLKPGGHVVIGEWLPTHRYAGYFREAGLTVYSSRSYFLKAFGPMWIVEARKPSIS